MAKLEKARSRRPKDRKLPETPEGPEKTPVRRATTKRRSSLPSVRPESTLDPLRSQLRPKTADRPGPNREHKAPDGREAIDVSSGGEACSPPLPTSRVPIPRNATFHAPALRESAQIGIALGSPSQRPPQFGRSFTAHQLPTRTPQKEFGVQGRRLAEQQPPAQPTPARPTTAQPTTAQPTTAQPTPPQPTPPQSKKLKQKWSVGALFRKSGKTAVEEPFYKLQPPQDAVPITLPKSPPSNPGPTPTSQHTPFPDFNPSRKSVSEQYSRTPSMHRGIARFEARAEGDKASFAAALTSSPQEATSSSEDIFTALHRLLQEREKQRALNSSPRPRAPRLDIDIPSVEMDRFSVMFEDLLDPPAPLLERRQDEQMPSNVGDDGQGALAPKRPALTLRLNPLLNAHQPERSASSPHLPLPQTTSNIHEAAEEQRAPVPAFHRPLRLRRSTTEPVNTGPQALAQSKLHLPDLPAAITTYPIRRPHSDSRGSHEPSANESEDSLPQTPDTMTTTSVEAVAWPIRVMTPQDRLPQQMRMSETPWDPVSPSSLVEPKPFPPDANLQATRTLRSARPRRSASSRSPSDTPPRGRSLTRRNDPVVQVAVARQVSVSRGQKMLQNAVEVTQRPRVVDVTAHGAQSTKSSIVVFDAQ